VPEESHNRRPFEAMSPASIAAFLDDPHVAACARDTDLRLIWCNRAFAENMGSTPERLAGSRLADVMTPEQARDREQTLRAAMRERRLASHQHFWVGKRWLSRVWPLDPHYFGREGCFVVITRLFDSPRIDGTVRLAPTADLGPLDVLSPRELEVFYYLAAGMSAGDVAKTLFRSEKTVGRHIENIHRKMGYANRAELVRDAVESGLVYFSSDEWRKLIDPRHAQD
jgi:DNA-binding CsgD family transcriptional regulator